MDTRNSLLNSAERVVRQRGYNGFSYADLADEIGIRKASIHHHFRTKADLGLSLIERYSATFFAALTDIRSKSQNSADELCGYVQLYRDALNDGEQVCLCVSLSAGRDHLSEAILKQLDQFHQGSIAWLEQAFTTARSDGSIAGVTTPDAEASAMLALMEGAQLLARASKDVTIFDSATAPLLARLAAKQNQ